MSTHENRFGSAGADPQLAVPHERPPGCLRLYGKLLLERDDVLFWPAARLCPRDPQLAEVPVIIPKQQLAGLATRPGELDFVLIDSATAGELGLSRPRVTPNLETLSF